MNVEKFSDSVLKYCVIFSSFFFCKNIFGSTAVQFAYLRILMFLKSQHNIFL